MTEVQREEVLFFPHRSDILNSSDKQNHLTGEENEFTQQATSINITSAKSIENPSIIPVRHWNAYGDAHEANNFQSDIDDQRESNGQAFITIGSIDGNLDNMMCVEKGRRVAPPAGIGILAEVD